MKILLIVLAVWLIPIIISFYVNAMIMKLEGNKGVITIGDVYDNFDDCIILAICPIINIFFCLMGTGHVILISIKHWRML